MKIMRLFKKIKEFEWGVLWRLLTYVKYEAWLTALYVVLKIIYIVVNFTAPIYLTRIFSEQLVDGMGAKDPETFKHLLIVCLSLMLAALLLRYIADVMSSLLGSRITMKMRNHLFSKLHRLSMQTYEQLSPGQVSSRLVGNLRSLSSLYSNGLFDLLSSIAIFASGYVIMWLNSPLITAVITLFLLIFFFINIFFMKKINYFTKLHIEKRSDLLSLTSEYLRNIPIIQAFNQVGNISKKYLCKVEEIIAVKNKAINYDNFVGYTFYDTLNSLMPVTIIAATVFLYFRNYDASTIVGAHTVEEVALVILMLQYFEKAIGSFTMVSLHMQSLGRNFTAAKHVFALYDLPDFVDKGVLPTADTQNEEAVKMSNVTFAYKEDVAVLKDLSFTISKGEKIAFVGHTGSGKSTILNLLMRFYDVQEGKVEIFGKNINEYQRDVLYKLMAIVLQDPHLFTGTVLENIQAGDSSISVAAAEEAFSLVGGELFYRNHPEKLASKVAEGGKNFSTGERQLIAFARALVRNPAILILDEATANIDSETEQIMHMALNNMAKNRTLIVIAHRLSTISDADKIFVLDHGRLIEQGTHKELLELGGTYANLWTLQ